MLRAVRFAARFGLSIDPATAAAIQADAPMLARISGERIESELRRMLTPPSRTEAYALLWQLSLIDTVFAPLDSHAGDTLESARSLFLALDPQQPITPALAYLCAMIDFRWHRAQRRPDLLGNLSPGEVPKLVAVARAALKLSNDDAEAMADVARWTHKLLSTHAPGIALLKRFLARPHVTSARQLLGALDSIGVAGERVQALQPQFDALAAGEVAPPPLLTGDMLVAAGYRPGPAFKRVLDAVYDAQLEDRVPTSEEAMELGRSLFDR
jgi:poly(A) polymerase